MPPRLVQLVFDGFGDGPAGITLDVVGAALRVVRAGLCEVPIGRLPSRARVVSIDGASVRSSAGRILSVDGMFNPRALGPGDVLVLPGLGMPTEREIIAGLARSDLARAAPLIARAAARGVLIAASCSATFLLAASGALDGREATTSWWLAPPFRRRFPRVVLRSDRMVVASGNLITAGSAFAHADLMLTVVAQTVSPLLAHRVARYLALDERASQARYMLLDHLRSSDPVVLALERFVAANLQLRLTIPQMARATGTSPRTLARRLHEAMGTTPLRFAQRLKIAQAAHLLETPRLSVDDVAARVGYAYAAAFRRVFRRETGQPPRARRPVRALRG
jgi:transcriptional regulator GlxA family with amidase domain